MQRIKRIIVIDEKKSGGKIWDYSMRLRRRML